MIPKCSMKIKWVLKLVQQTRNTRICCVRFSVKMLEKVSISIVQKKT